MRVVVGSKNPVKTEAVTQVFQELFGAKVKVAGVEITSGVSDQPIGDEEAIKGANTRARKALRSADGVEYGVGLEGGVFEIEDKMYECAWCAVWSKDGRKGLGGGLRFEIPEEFARMIRGGDWSVDESPCYERVCV